MILVKMIILFLVFLSELTALIALGYWGWQTQNVPFLKWVSGFGIPAIAAVFWGLLLAPKSVFSVGVSIKLVLKLVVYTISTWALFMAGKGQIALIFFIVSILLNAVAEIFHMTIDSTQG